jgi:hypothetical protein
MRPDAYNWGNNFATTEDGLCPRGNGVAPTPGSRTCWIDTMELVQCTKELCPFGEESRILDGSSTVHGVWLGVCRQQPTPSQAIITEFCAFAASKQESIKAIIPNATAGGVRSRPFRASQYRGLRGRWIRTRDGETIY